MLCDDENSNVIEHGNRLQVLDELAHQATRLMVTNLSIKVHGKWRINNDQWCRRNRHFTFQALNQCCQLVDCESTPNIQSMQMISS
tara:strand:+ start:782 stop:1039 length:258 start_codon:yes stop_codon:yes gene_type:complete